MSETDEWSLQRVGFPGSIYTLPADKKSVTIGRRPCHIVCEGRKVSRLHCRLDFSNKNWHVTDLESVGGVFINKKHIRVNHPTVLHDGDIIGIGVSQMSYSGLDTYLFKFCRTKSAKEQVSKLYFASLSKCQVVLKDIGTLLSNQVSISVDVFFQLETQSDCGSPSSKNVFPDMVITEPVTYSNGECYNQEPTTGPSCHDVNERSEAELSLEIRMPEESDVEDSNENVWLVLHDSEDDDEDNLLHLPE